MRLREKIMLCVFYFVFPAVGVLSFVHDMRPWWFHAPHWEVVPVAMQGKASSRQPIIGYRAKWTKPDDKGRFSYTETFLKSDERDLRECRRLAIAEAERLQANYIWPHCE